MQKDDEKVGQHSTTSSSSSLEKVTAITDQVDESSEDNSSVPATLIGAHNYISLTEGNPCALTKEELTEAVVKCKELVLNSAVCSEERKWLVRRLIELRYQLLRLNDKEQCGSPEEMVSTRIVLGHHFKLHYEPTSPNKRYCDTCCGVVWNITQSWYQCTDCRYRCHTKCTERITRQCAHLTSSDNSGYEKNICPEAGLPAQNYKCAECSASISFKNLWDPPRLCDYSGLYYCSRCHWNNILVIPARVMHNWDFTLYPVSRAAYQLMRFTRHQTLIKLDPRLYGFVKELAEIKRLRQEMSFMKLYLVRCQEAKAEKKLLCKHFGSRTHLLQQSEAFSLQDLTDLHSGKLLDQMTSLASQFSDHISKNCLVCMRQGLRCELCVNEDLIFPFYSSIYVCPDCSWCYHKDCWLQNPECTKCQRIEQRKRNSEIE